MYEYYVLGTYGQSIWATDGDYDNTLGLQESTLDVTGGAPVGSLHQIQFDDSSRSPLAPSRAVNYSVNVLLGYSWTVYDDHDSPVPDNEIRLIHRDDADPQCCEYQTFRLRAHATAWDQPSDAIGLDVTDRVSGFHSFADGVLVVTQKDRFLVVTGDCDVDGGAPVESTAFPGVFVSPVLDPIRDLRTVVTTSIIVHATQSPHNVYWSSADDSDELTPQVVDTVYQAFDNQGDVGKAHVYANFSRGVIMDLSERVNLTAVVVPRTFLAPPVLRDGYWEVAIDSHAVGDVMDGSPLLHAALYSQGCAEATLLAEVSDTLCINLPAPTPVPTPAPTQQPTPLPTPLPTRANMPYTLHSLSADGACDYLHGADVLLGDVWAGDACTSMTFTLSVATRNDVSSAVQTVAQFESSDSGFDLDEMLEWNVTQGAHLVSIEAIGDGRARVSALSLGEFLAGALQVSVRAKRTGDVNETLLFDEFGVNNTLEVQVPNGVVTHSGLTADVSRHLDDAASPVATATSASPSASIGLHGLACSGAWEYGRVSVTQTLLRGDGSTVDGALKYETLTVTHDATLWVDAVAASNTAWYFTGKGDAGGAAASAGDSGVIDITFNEGISITADLLSTNIEASSIDPTFQEQSEAELDTTGDVSTISGRFGGSLDYVYLKNVQVEFSHPDLPSFSWEYVRKGGHASTSLSRWWTPFNPDTNWQSERRVLQDQLSIDSNASTLLSPSDGGSGSDERRWYVGYGNSWRELSVSYSFCSLSATERFFVNLAADEANDDYTIDETDGLRSDVGVDDADEWEYEYPSDDHGVRSEPSATLSLADTDDGGVKATSGPAISAQEVGTPFDVHVYLEIARPMATKFTLFVYDSESDDSDDGALCTFGLGDDDSTYYYFCDDTAVFALERNDALDAAYNLFSPSDTLLAGGALSSAVDLMVHMTESSLGVAFDLSFKSTPADGITDTVVYWGSFKLTPVAAGSFRVALGVGVKQYWTSNSFTHYKYFGSSKTGYLLGSEASNAPVHVVASSSRRLASPHAAAPQLATPPVHRRSRRLDDCVTVNDLNGDDMFDNIDVTACYDFDSLGVDVAIADKSLNGEVTALDCYIMNLQRTGKLPIAKDSLRANMTECDAGRCLHAWVDMRELAGTCGAAASKTDVWVEVALLDDNSHTNISDAVVLGEVQGQQETTTFVDGGDAVVRSTLVQASASMSQPDSSATRFGVSIDASVFVSSTVRAVLAFGVRMDSGSYYYRAFSDVTFAPWSGSKLLANLIVELPVAATTTTGSPILTPSASPTREPQPLPTSLPTSFPSVSCAPGTSIYRLTLLDSAGDGWQGAAFEVRDDAGAVVASDTLVSGYSSTEWLCLVDGCYELEVTGGVAPDDIGFTFHDEAAGHFSGASAPFSDSLCVADGSAFAFPTQSPSLSAVPTILPSAGPTTSHPTSSPSHVPTTKVLTWAPSLVPIAKSTVAPSAAPAQVPIPTPTSLPTPTPRPSVTIAVPSLTPIPQPTATRAYVVEAHAAAVVQLGDASSSAADFGRRERLCFARALVASVELLTNVSQVRIVSVSDYPLTESERRALQSTPSVLVNFTMHVRSDDIVASVAASTVEDELYEEVLVALAPNTSDASSFNAELEHAAEQLNATALLGASIDTPATSAVLEETWTATLHTTAEEPACVCPRCDDDAVTAVTPTPSSAPTAAWLARLPSSAPSAAWLNASSPPQIVASNTPAEGWSTEGGEYLALTLRGSCPYPNVSLASADRAHVLLCSESVASFEHVSLATPRTRVTCRTPSGVGAGWDVQLDCAANLVAEGGDALFSYAAPAVEALSFPIASVACVRARRRARARAHTSRSLDRSRARARARAPRRESLTRATPASAAAGPRSRTSTSPEAASSRSSAATSARAPTRRA